MHFLIPDPRIGLPNSISITVTLGLVIHAAGMTQDNTLTSMVCDLCLLKVNKMLGWDNSNPRKFNFADGNFTSLENSLLRRTLF